MPAPSWKYMAVPPWILTVTPLSTFSPPYTTIGLDEEIVVSFLHSWFFMDMASHDQAFRFTFCVLPLSSVNTRLCSSFGEAVSLVVFEVGSTYTLILSPLRISTLLV